MDSLQRDQATTNSELKSNLLDQTEISSSLKAMLSEQMTQNDENKETSKSLQLLLSELKSSIEEMREFQNASVNSTSIVDPFES